MLRQSEGIAADRWRHNGIRHQHIDPMNSVPDASERGSDFPGNSTRAGDRGRDGVGGQPHHRCERSHFACDDSELALACADRFNRGVEQINLAGDVADQAGETFDGLRGNAELAAAGVISAATGSLSRSVMAYARSAFLCQPNIFAMLPIAVLRNLHLRWRSISTDACNERGAVVELRQCNLWDKFMLPARKFTGTHAPYHAHGAAFLLTEPLSRSRRRTDFTRIAAFRPQQGLPSPYTSSTVDPVVLRAARSACAFAASLSG
jgi:hypothetical protein